MDATASATFLRFFEDLPDPRSDLNALHDLGAMIVIAVMGVICGCDGWVPIHAFAVTKQAWLQTFLRLPNGIPSHDTFSRLFARLDPDAFERCFAAWMAALAQRSDGRLVAIDGKALRRSFAHAWDKGGGMAHLVGAFARENRMVIGQLAVDGKSNEITAIPRLLELLDLRGAVVTIDAMGCQRAVAGAIVDAGADYVLTLKDNHPALRERAEALMAEAALDHAEGGDANADGRDGSLRRSFAQRTEEGHGRVETRRVLVTDEVDALGPAADGWAGLGSVILVETTRQDLGDMTGHVSAERRLHISSLRGPAALDAARMGDLVRGHWCVENGLHWQLDVTFGEDQRRIRKGHGAENFSRLCRIGLNLLGRDTTRKVGIKTKRLIAGWDHDYLLKILAA